jgi:hypothetical protein
VDIGALADVLTGRPAQARQMPNIAPRSCATTEDP